VTLTLNYLAAKSGELMALYGLTCEGAGSSFLTGAKVSNNYWPSGIFVRNRILYPNECAFAFDANSDYRRKRGSPCPPIGHQKASFERLRRAAQIQHQDFALSQGAFESVHEMQAARQDLLLWMVTSAVGFANMTQCVGE
jgi:hypothetical protein